MAGGDSILVLSGVDLLDGAGDPLRRNVDITIRGSIIRSISEHGRLDTPASAEVLNLEGSCVIPGLIEGHAHITGASGKSLERMLEAGITTLRDMAGDGGYLRDLQAAVRDGEVMAPDIYFSALVGGPDLILEDARAKLSTPMEYRLGSAPWMRAVDESSDVVQLVADALECGARGMKIYSHINGGMVDRITAEAHRRGLKVWAHSFVGPATPEEVVAAGVDVISHAPGLLCSPDWAPGTGSFEFYPDEIGSPRFERIIAAMRQHGTMLDPTVAVFDIRLSATGTEADSLKRRAVWEVVRRVHAEGIPLVVGSDLPPPRSGAETQPLYAEMKLLSDKVGLSPLEVITAATGNNAIALGIEDSHGTIGPGKAADMVVLSSDPTISVPREDEIVLVIKNGRIVSRGNGGEQ
jgi:imidazolonepropionase-like amidohydrolase